METTPSPRRIRAGRNPAAFPPQALQATLASLFLAFAFGAMSCQHEPPTRPAEPGRPALAARTPIGSTKQVTWIYNLTDLRNISDLGGNYKLANDINASATAQTPFVPIGAVTNFFHGTFDGNNKTISNLNIVGTGSYTGIFTKTYHAVFKNIRLVNVTVSGGYSTGAIAGYAANVDLTNSSISGRVTGNSSGDRLGLAFGSAGYFTRIYRSSFRGRVAGRGYHFGGVIGHAAYYGPYNLNDDGRVLISEVFVLDTIAPTFPSGSAMVASGGVVGTLIGGVLENVNAVATVTGRHAAGGLVGNIVNDNPNSNRCKTRGCVSRGVVTDDATPNRTGAIGMMSGPLEWVGATYYDTDSDGGVVNPNISDPACQTGFSSAVLKAPHPDPDKLLYPYVNGGVVTQANINSGAYPQCSLASGTDGDWGFGTCGQTAIWAANSSSEYSTLLRIPDPSVQPKN